MVISRLGHRSILYMFGSRLSRVAASSNRCIIDSKGLSSLISLASSTKALGIDFLPGTDMNAWGEHYLNGAKHLRSRLSEFTCAYHWEPRLYPTFGTSSMTARVGSRRTPGLI